MASIFDFLYIKEANEGQSYYCDEKNFKCSGRKKKVLTGKPLLQRDSPGYI
jgi:hypothetical protein